MNWSSVAKAIDRLNDRVGEGISWLTTLLVLLVCVDVVVRYVLRQSAAWVMELEWHIFALIFLFGGGYALRHDRHVRVDLFYANFKERDKALVDLIGHLLFLLPWCAMLIWAGTAYAVEAYRDGEGSPNPGGLPYFFLIKSAIPIGLTLLLLQGVAQIIHAWRTYRGRADEGLEHHAHAEDRL